MSKRFSLIAVLLFVLLAAVAPAFAQEAPAEPASSIWDIVDRADILIALTVVLAMALFIFRPALVKLVDGANASVPEGAAREFALALERAGKDALDRYIAARQADAALTPSPWDDKAWEDIKTTIQTLHDRLNRIEQAPRG